MLSMSNFTTKWTDFYRCNLLSHSACSITLLPLLHLSSCHWSGLAASAYATAFVKLTGYLHLFLCPCCLCQAGCWRKAVLDQGDHWVQRGHWPCDKGRAPGTVGNIVPHSKREATALTQGVIISPNDLSTMAVGTALHFQRRLVTYSPKFCLLFLQEKCSAHSLLLLSVLWH